VIVAEKDGTRPLVSVVVPTYNSARTIERCLRALVAQATDHPFEVIVVDSGQDATLEVATRISSKIRTVRLPERAVAPAARNAGVRTARGDILAFIDSDAYADDAWIDNVVQAADTGYDLVCGSIANANPHSAVARAEQLLMFNEFLPELPGGPYWFALSGNMLLRRSSFERYGPFVAVRAAEDVVFSRRLLDAGGTVLFYPALRVAHENRTRPRPYFRNQFVVGKHTAIARRLVRFADTQRYWLFLALLPVAPAAKLAKIAGRLAVRSPRSLIDVARQMPLLLAGIFAYSAGLVAGALTPSAKIHGTGEPSLDHIAAHERCASDSVKTA
jgi:glycosyltransferase involved in cell wall biosynthesis